MDNKESALDTFLLYQNSQSKAEVKDKKRCQKKHCEFIHIKRSNIADDLKLLEKENCDEKIKICALQILFWSTCCGDVGPKVVSTSYSGKSSYSCGSSRQKEEDIIKRMNTASEPRVKLQIAIGTMLQSLGALCPHIIGGFGQLEWPDIVSPSDIPANTSKWIRNLISRFFDQQAVVKMLNPLFQIEAYYQNVRVEENKKYILDLIEKCLPTLSQSDSTSSREILKRLEQIKKTILSGEMDLELNCNK